MLTDRLNVDDTLVLLDHWGHADNTVHDVIAGVEELGQ